MSRWNDSFQNHAFRVTWNSLKAVLAEDLQKGTDEAVTKEVARLRKVATFSDSIIEQVDPELFPLSQLEPLNQHASNCLNEVNAFKGDQNIGHLHNANVHIESLFSILSQTTFGTIAHQKGALGKAASAYATTIDSHLAKLNQAVDKEIADVKTSVTEIQTGIADNKKTLGSLTEQLQTVGQAIQGQTAEFNTQFQSSEKSRADKFDAITTKLQQKADDEFKELATKAGTALKVLGKFQDDTAKVYGVVVNTLQAGAYSQYADQEKNKANGLRWSAILLMMLGVAILVAPEIAKLLKDAAAYQLDWKVTLGRIPFSLILFVPAFYLARESSKHRGNEILNRRRELILSTIDPYLALLDEKKAEEIKVEIAKGIFSEGTLPNEQSASDSSNLLAQLSNLAKQLNKS